MGHLQWYDERHACTGDKKNLRLLDECADI